MEISGRGGRTRRAHKKAIKKHPRELGCLLVALLGALQLSLHSLTFGALSVFLFSCYLGGLLIV
ncbi:MAG: hypothetical protein IJZ62_05955, partial [Clostridia bacterium]|nr:hypothetical protein [Clostridia bacterium]